MIAQVNKKDLEAAVATAYKAISSKSPLPVYSHFLVEGRNGSVKISATDGRFSIEFVIAAEISQEGAFTTPAKIFQELIGLLPDEPIVLIHENDVFEIRSSISSHKLKTLPAGEFPQIPSFYDNTNFKIKKSDFTALIKSVLFAAASQNETKAILTGVLAAVEDNRLRLTATDGKRLAFNSCEMENDSGYAGSFVIPGKNLSEIAKSVKPSDDDFIYVGIEKGKVFFRMDNIFMVSGLLEGRFPNVEQVIPQTHEKTVAVDGAQLMLAIKRASVTAQDKDMQSLIVLDISENLMKVKSNTPDVGSALEELPCRLEGENIEIAFNGKFFIDILSVMGGDTVLMEMTDYESPVKLRFAGQEHFIYVIMPIVLR